MITSKKNRTLSLYFSAQTATTKRFGSGNSSEKEFPQSFLIAKTPDNNCVIFTDSHIYPERAGFQDSDAIYAGPHVLIANLEGITGAGKTFCEERNLPEISLRALVQQAANDKSKFNYSDPAALDRLVKSEFKL